MNRKMIWAIAKKDMRSIWKTSKVWIGLILLPLLLGVIFPTVAVLAGRSMDLNDAAGSLMRMLEQLPLGNTEGLPTDNHRLVYFVVNFLLAPLFMLIPVINALMIAVNSFVGEKERRTLESLLFSPIEIKDLFIGKLLASFVPAYVAALGSFVLSGIIINVLAYPLFERMIFPNVNWLMLMLWVIPAFTLFTILFSVWVSARSKSFQEAQQVAGVVVLPIIGILIAQSSGLLIIGPLLMAVLGAVLLAVSFILLGFISKMNQRNVLFERQVQ